MIDQHIHQYGRRLYGLCLTLCANSADADDLYQETWLKVLKNYPQYDSTRAFEPWLTKICVNIYRNRLRRLIRSPVWDSFTSSEEKDAVIVSVPAPEPEDYNELHEAISRLPEKHRIVVILFYFRDMDIKKTSHTLGIPEGTVKSRLNKAKSLLKEALQSETNIPF